LENILPTPPTRPGPWPLTQIAQPVDKLLREREHKKSEQQPEYRENAANYADVMPG